MGALVPSQQQSNPYAQPNPYNNPYMAQQANPYGQPPQQQPPPQPVAAVDPFSVFEAQSAAAAPQQAPGPAAASTAIVPAAAEPAPAPAMGGSDEDFWGGFSANAPESAPSAAENTKPKVPEEKKGDDGLPPGGEWYDARIFTPTLGVMFFKPQELTDSLFLNTERSTVDSLLDRPVVAFIVEGSSARSAGVELGHVLLKVNGVDVRNPKEASRLIKEGPRPLPLLFYVPSTDIVIAEGEHMVKYDTRETTAPNSAKDWKPKYVVIGGIIAQPWMMNMYRSKVRFTLFEALLVFSVVASSWGFIFFSFSFLTHFLFCTCCSRSMILPSLRHKLVVLCLLRSNSSPFRGHVSRMIGKDRRW